MCVCVCVCVCVEGSFGIYQRRSLTYLRVLELRLFLNDVTLRLGEDGWSWEPWLKDIVDKKNRK